MRGVPIVRRAVRWRVRAAVGKALAANAPPVSGNGGQPAGRPETRTTEQSSGWFRARGKGDPARRFRSLRRFMPLRACGARKTAIAPDSLLGADCGLMAGMWHNPGSIVSSLHRPIRIGAACPTNGNPFPSVNPLCRRRRAPARQPPRRLRWRRGFPNRRAVTGRPWKWRGGIAISARRG